MIYVKNAHLKWLFTFAMTLFMLSSGIAQEGNDPPCVEEHVLKICQIGNWGGEDVPPSNCENTTVWGTNNQGVSDDVEILITAYAVNIPGASNLPGSTNISFPANYPKPFLRYESSPGQYMYTEELTNWTFEQQITTQNCQLYDLYSASKLVTVQLPSWASCDEETSTIEFTIDLRLSTTTVIYGDFYDYVDYIDYPLSDYGAPGEIFSCEVFFDTRHICNPRLDYDPLTTIDICIPCNIVDGNYEGRSEKTTTKSQIKKLTNPFSESLNFIFESEIDNEIVISLYNNQGQRILEKSQRAFKGTTKIEISVENIPTGIYYLTILSDDKRIVEKVICSN